jgi:hypothetical protein
VDSASALTPIIDDVEEKLLGSVRKYAQNDMQLATKRTKERMKQLIGKTGTEQASKAPQIAWQEYGDRGD